jgi:glycosyltransferase involved in cell wall biosynthesis
MIDHAITWVGWMTSTASFPVVNRNLTAELGRLGFNVLVNVHNVGTELTPLAVTFQYPPQPINIRHKFNVCMSLWEFSGGARAVPQTFKDVFQGFDLVLCPNQFVFEQYHEATQTPVRVVPYLGVDAGEFAPIGPTADWEALFPGETWMRQARKIVLMVGGSDARHGWDVAEYVIKHLPADVHMVAKLSVHYPRKLSEPQHPRIHKLYTDLTTLAPLYRASDVFLMSARGVGFSLPVIEALSCGLPVASTNLSPIRDFANDHVIIAEAGQYVPMGIHHCHQDCLPLWWEPDKDALLEATRAALELPKRQPGKLWVETWSWKERARALVEELKLWQ